VLPEFSIAETQQSSLRTPEKQPAVAGMATTLASLGKRLHISKETSVKTSQSESGLSNLLSRRAMIVGVSAAAFFRCSRALADPVDDGLCDPTALFSRHSPWLVTFNEQLHPFTNGLPTIRPGQLIKGTWSLFTWACVAKVVSIRGLPATQDRWIGTSDPSHSDWTPAIQFDRHDIVSAVTQGDFTGLPDAATQPDFYKLLGNSHRVLNLIVKDKSGNLMLVQGTHHAGFGGSSDPISGSQQLLLVADTSVSVVFAPSAPADGTVFNWKVDTFTVVIEAKAIITIPGAPFSPLTATGTIIFTDQTSASPLPSQTTPYSLSIPVGSAPLFVATAATGSQNFQWPWFDHTPLGGVNGPTSRTVK
jgi:hypothetical protein